MFRSVGKSKIGIALAIVFGISLFFIRGGSRYSNFLNSDNVVATISGTPISTTKFNRTIQLNINQFSEMLGKKLSSEEIKTFQIHSLALGALINDAIFENEYDKQGFNIDEKIIAKKTKDKLPQLYNSYNKLDESALNQFLQQQRLKIEDIVQIIDFETRNELFNDAFFNISYPMDFLKKIVKYDNHKRKIKYFKVPLESINLEGNIGTDESQTIKSFYNENINQYMSQENRDIEYIIVNKKDYSSKFIPSDFEVNNYYNDNKHLFLKNERRSFLQYNFKTLEDAEDFRKNINNLNMKETVEYSNNNNIKFNTFDSLFADEVLNEISNVLFQLQIGENSQVIETAIAKHVIILENIKPKYQLKLEEAKEKIIITLTSLEVDNYYNELNNNISESILKGNSIERIADEFNLQIKKINKLSQNYSNFENNRKDFYKSLITNSFASNKDFVSDIIQINSESFYIFNVTNIEISKPIELIMIKEKVSKDWNKSKKIKQFEKKLLENETNSYFINQLSITYDQIIKEAEIDKNSLLFPTKLIAEIFKKNQDSLAYTIDENNLYVVKIEDILIDNNEIDNIKALSLMSNIRSSFGSELLKKVKISTNDSLIDALVDSY